MKKVLVIHYSQSGQLTEIVNNIAMPISEGEAEVDYYKIALEKEFPFPWNKSAFFDAFPESFLQKPRKLKAIPAEILHKKYDLIILGYQVWYLSPSIPINSLLKSPEAKILFNNTPVITVIGCRNMWIMAQEKVKCLLNDCGAKLVGNIALVDRHINHISVITIVQWMFTGVKKKYLGIFPKPGVSQKDINESSKFGSVIAESLANGNYDTLQANLLKINAVKIKPFLVLVDKRANVLFGKWAKLISEKGEAESPKRHLWLSLFNYYLLFAIWIIAPIVFILFLLTYIPFLRRINKDKKYYSSIELK
ncbi:MAG: dialkylresorcinol condensing enzyme DarA [Kordia sp.]|nr:MAG: dialkylresorcinol condensing enzyme DarA [Kordia sp.]